jgi:hypothetical protein
MIAFPLHPVLSLPLHGALGSADEFICLGLIALALVIATFVVRGGEKKEEDRAAPAEAQRSAKELK